MGWQSRVIWEPGNSVIIKFLFRTCISIIAFSLILAAFTKSANEILIVGNFPLLLFMFFTGVAFPMEGNALVTIASYPISFQGLMSPIYVISALKRVLTMDVGITDVLPEIIVLVILTSIYFGIGVWVFQRRHMRVGNDGVVNDEIMGCWSRGETHPK